MSLRTTNVKLTIVRPQDVRNENDDFTREVNVSINRYRTKDGYEYVADAYISTHGKADTPADAKNALADHMRAQAERLIWAAAELEKHDVSVHFAERPAYKL